MFGLCPCKPHQISGTTNFLRGIPPPSDCQVLAKNQQHHTDWALASEFFGGQPCNSRWAQARELSGKVDTGSKPKRALKLFTIKHHEQRKPADKFAGRVETS
jgi:hypothetical protein